MDEEVETLETSCSYEAENVVNQNFFDDCEDFGIRYDEIEASVYEVAGRADRVEKDQSNETICYAESISKDFQ